MTSAGSIRGHPAGRAARRGPIRRTPTNCTTRWPARTASTPRKRSTAWRDWFASPVAKTGSPSCPLRPSGGEGGDPSRERGGEGEVGLPVAPSPCFSPHPHPNPPPPRAEREVLGCGEAGCRKFGAVARSGNRSAYLATASHPTRSWAARGSADRDPAREIGGVGWSPRPRWPRRSGSSREKSRRRLWRWKPRASRCAGAFRPMWRPRNGANARPSARIDPIHRQPAAEPRSSRSPPAISWRFLLRAGSG